MNNFLEDKNTGFSDLVKNDLISMTFNYLARQDFRQITAQVIVIGKCLPYLCWRGVNMYFAVDTDHVIGQICKADKNITLLQLF